MNKEDSNWLANHFAAWGKMFDDDTKRRRLAHVAQMKYRSLPWWKRIIAKRPTP